MALSTVTKDHDKEVLVVAFTVSVHGRILLPETDGAMESTYIPDMLKGQLYRSLERCLRAGMPVAQSLRALSGDCEVKLATRLRATASRVAHGSSLAEAIGTTRLLPPRDVLALHTGEQAGRLGEVSARLADFYEAKSSRARKLRGKLAYPAVILLLAVVLLPFPDFIAGRLSGYDFLLRVFIPPILLFGGYKWLQWSLRRGGRASWSEGPMRLVMALPFFGALARDRARAEMLDGAALLHGAGVPAATALEQAATSVANPIMRKRFRTAAQVLAAGRGVAEALQAGDVLVAPDAYAILSTAEAAGRLDDGLKCSAEAARASIDDRRDLVAEWLPRVLYCLVVVWLAAGLLL